MYFGVNVLHLYRVSMEVAMSEVRVIKEKKGHNSESASF
jgi:hypothetical protein